MKTAHNDQSDWNDFCAGYGKRFAALLYQFMVKERATCDSPEYFHVDKLDDNQSEFQAHGPSYNAEAVLMASLPSYPINGYMNRVTRSRLLYWSTTNWKKNSMCALG